MIAGYIVSYTLVELWVILQASSTVITEEERKRKSRGGGWGQEGKGVPQALPSISPPLWPTEDHLCSHSESCRGGGESLKRGGEGE